ncbi:MAG TPA: c-type cytochrome, partial [Lacipirellulaceae bacterium]|nr:c-type cytochrome [Lacipirellulaceae bacterium]
AQYDAIEYFLKGLHRNPHRSDILKGDAAKRLHKLSVECLSTANNEDAKPEMRAACLRIIGRDPLAADSQVHALGTFLSADHESQLQLAAIDALSERTQPEVAKVLLSAWRSLSPTLRSRALDVLLTRKQWVKPLLAAIENKSIAAGEIDAPHRHRLTEYPDADLRKKAEANLSQDGSKERLAVFNRYAPLIHQGDIDRGKAVFTKNCSPCHLVKGIGNQVGPDLAARQDKSGEGLLREILDPNRAVDGRFAEYTAVTTDGVVKTGVLAAETSGSITLRAQLGVETTLLRSQLESLTSLGRSPMPEGFENQITPNEMSDLLSFLAAP